MVLMETGPVDVDSLNHSGHQGPSTFYPGREGLIQLAETGMFSPFQCVSFVLIPLKLQRTWTSHRTRERI